jgi:predicted deacetylase
VSIHDVAPATWPECEALLALLAPFGVHTTLLVTPHYRGGVRLDAAREVATALRERTRGGDEVVLHGYYHRDDGPPPRSARDWAMRRLWTDREGEFAALDASDAARRLSRGAAILRRVGLEPAGFVAPAWLLGRGAQAALRASALRYTCTRDLLLALPGFEPVRAPSLVYSTRAAWRRVLSRHWNRHRLDALELEPRVRVALHPAEARYPRVLAEWRVLLERLAAERRGVLETSWLARQNFIGVSASAASRTALPCAAGSGISPLSAR